MASPTQDILSNLQIDFGTSTSFTALLKDWTLPEFLVEAIETHHQESALAADFGTKRVVTVIPGDYIRFGVITGNWYYNPDLIPPIGISQVITVTFPSGATWACAGAFMRTYGGEAQEIDGVMMAPGEIVLGGDVNITAAA